MVQYEQVVGTLLQTQEHSLRRIQNNLCVGVISLQRRPSLARHVTAGESNVTSQNIWAG